MERIILHSDCNSFYASVECALNPTLKGKAIAVSGNPEKRHGIILTKSE
ncbi:MAG: DNA polymerase IV, partial [Clostridia bacterium]|nr:DNA polymerase IV [Clostridia bacterium]